MATLVKLPCGAFKVKNGSFWMGGWGMPVSEKTATEFPNRTAVYAYCKKHRIIIVREVERSNLERR